MSGKDHISAPTCRPISGSVAPFNWGIGIVTAVALTFVLCVGWVQNPLSASELHTRSYAQHVSHPVAVDFRFDHRASTGNPTPTVWEAAQERKPERDGKDREVNPPYSYSIEIAHSLHERKSQFAQQRQASEAPGISLVILYHAWKGYLS